MCCHSVPPTFEIIGAGWREKLQQYTSLYCKPIDRQGDVVRSAHVPLLYPCRYAREKLSVRESDRRCPPLAFCPKRISVGRAHHHRKHMHSIRLFRTKVTLGRNILHFYAGTKREMSQKKKNNTIRDSNHGPRGQSDSNLPATPLYLLYA